MYDARQRNNGAVYGRVAQSSSEERRFLNASGSTYESEECYMEDDDESRLSSSRSPSNFSTNNGSENHPPANALFSQGCFPAGDMTDPGIFGFYNAPTDSRYHPDNALQNPPQGNHVPHIQSHPPQYQQVQYQRPEFNYPLADPLPGGQFGQPSSGTLPFRGGTSNLSQEPPAFGQSHSQHLDNGSIAASYLTRTAIHQLSDPNLWIVYAVCGVFRGAHSLRPTNGQIHCLHGLFGVASFGDWRAVLQQLYPENDSAPSPSNLHNSQAGYVDLLINLWKFSVRDNARPSHEQIEYACELFCMDGDQVEARLRTEKDTCIASRRLGARKEYGVNQRACVRDEPDRILIPLPKNKDRPYVCTTCYGTFEKKTQWRKHEEKNFIRQVFVCPLPNCRGGSKVFLQKCSYKRHAVKLHPHESPQSKSADAAKVTGLDFDRLCVFAGCPDRFETWKQRIDHIAEEFMKRDDWKTADWRAHQDNVDGDSDSESHDYTSQGDSETSSGSDDDDDGADSGRPGRSADRDNTQPKRRHQNSSSRKNSKAPRLNPSQWQQSNHANTLLARTSLPPQELYSARRVKKDMTSDFPMQTARLSEKRYHDKDTQVSDSTSGVTPSSSSDDTDPESAHMNTDAARKYQKNISRSISSDVLPLRDLTTLEDETSASSAAVVVPRKQPSRRVTFASSAGHEDTVCRATANTREKEDRRRSSSRRRDTGDTVFSLTSRSFDSMSRGGRTSTQSSATTQLTESFASIKLCHSPAPIQHPPPMTNLSQLDLGSAYNEHTFQDE